MGELTIGKYTYGSPERRGLINNINIGKFCSIAEGVIVDGGFQHDYNFISTYPFSTKFFECSHLPSHITCKGDVNIGSDVWIGEQAVIMSGVTIGHGAVIGLRAIVSKDVEPYSILVGAPQRVIKKRFNDIEVQMLLQMKWWDWSDERIKECTSLLMSKNINELYNKYLTWT